MQAHLHVNTTSHDTVFRDFMLGTVSAAEDVAALAACRQDMLRAHSDPWPAGAAGQ